MPTTLGASEAEAIALAYASHARLLLLDERSGRTLAQRLGLPVAGSLAVLLQAKQQGLVPLLREIVQQGRRISPQLRALVLRRAGE